MADEDLFNQLFNVTLPRQKGTECYVSRLHVQHAYESSTRPHLSVLSYAHPAVTGETIVRGSSTQPYYLTIYKFYVLIFLNGIAIIKLLEEQPSNFHTYKYGNKSNERQGFCRQFIALYARGVARAAQFFRLENLDRNVSVA